MNMMLTFMANAFMPIQGTEIASSVDGFYSFLLISSLISAIILIGGMTAFIIKYKRKTATDQTAYITHNTLAEFTWSFIPFVIMMVIFYWGKVIFTELRSMPEAGEEIHVVGMQWAWNFKYKNGIKQYTKDGISKDNKIGNVEKQVMVVPINKPVKLVMTSNDVIHSFYVPGFRNKQDVIPGRYTAFWFKANKLGEFKVFCTEYCGLQHSQMPATIRVVSEMDYKTWLDTNKPAEGAESNLGKELYESKCRSCHSLDGSRVVGPTWKGIYGAKREFESGPDVIADENYLRESILNPAAKIVKGYPAAMPPYAGQLSDDEVQQLIEYMKTIK